MSAVSDLCTPYIYTRRPILMQKAIVVKYFFSTRNTVAKPVNGLRYLPPS